MIITLQQENVILLVVSTFRIFPIYVEPVETSIPQIRYSAVYERLPRVSRRWYVLELLRAEGPSTFREKKKQKKMEKKIFSERLQHVGIIEKE